MTRKSSTETLVAAMRILARDIQSGDSVANVAIAEAAARLAELHADHLRDATKMAELEARISYQQMRIKTLIEQRNRMGQDVHDAAITGTIPLNHPLADQLGLVANLRAKVAELEAQVAIGRRAVASGLVVGEPFAWATFDGEGGYDLRLYEGNESYRDDWQAVNRRFRDWVIPLYYAEPEPATVAVDAGALEALRSAMSKLQAPMSRTEYAAARAGIIEAAYRLLEGGE